MIFRWRFLRSLLDEMEDGFRDYLYTFFQDEGMPWLAISLQEGSKFNGAYHILNDLKIALNRPLYEKLIENCFYYAPPYYPLYEFAQKFNNAKHTTLTVYEWLQLGVREKFLDFMNNTYPKANVIDILKVIRNTISKSI